MTELWFDAEADATFDALERDPRRRRLLAAINSVLEKLLHDPTDAAVRPRLFTNTEPPLWCVQLFADDEEWVVLWNPHPQLADAVVVQYLGPGRGTPVASLG